MRRRILQLIVIPAVILAGGCSQESSSETKRVGGCSSDTVSLDMDIELADCGGPTPVRLSILSVGPADGETYREAASGLAALLTRMGVGICSRPQLVIITDGPCWPSHRIDFRLEKGSEKRFGEIRSALEGGSLAGARPVGERPDDFGLFFVQAGIGSTDRWTLWYGRRPR